ncbi:TetR/AcrR family transcriptional regulator [Streptomyces sp. NPDC059740]|uniref:TetR/AcrR family transcriptional regulator n=1 Tax=Streptomyces sp. NPDC059740 TaxID=3346926 RepID=UPI003653881E
MTPRSASVNEELRRRSRERLLRATVELVAERGYEATTLADIAVRAGAARGLVSYYFSGKRELFQCAVHRLMHRTVSAALSRPSRRPEAEAGPEALARAVDAILGLTQDQPLLMRTHMAGLVTAEGFIECSEQQELARRLQEAVRAYGSRSVERDYRLLRAVLMGSVYTLLLPGAQLPLDAVRREVFDRFGLDWDMGDPPDGDGPGTDLPPAPPGALHRSLPRV